MAEFCFVVERIEWEDDLLNSNHKIWEDRHICRVCRTWEDARSFAEKHAGNFPNMRWKGDLVYSGKYVDNLTERELRYEIHYVPLL